MWRAVLILGLAACGRLGFDESGDDPPSDARCWPAWHGGNPTLTPPQRIAELEGGRNAALSADDLTMYFERANDVFATQRTARDAPWTAPVRLDALDTNASEGRMSTTGDGTLAVFSSDRGGNTDLWAAQRPDRASDFGVPGPGLVDALNTGDAELDPELTPDGLALYYAPFDAVEQRIVVARRASTNEPFAPPATFAELQLSSAVGDPTVSPDELVIAFSSGATQRDNDLYFATRTDRSEPFGTPALIPGINLPAIDDGDVELSSDGCEVIFMSDRSGDKQLYVARVE